MFYRSNLLKRAILGLVAMVTMLPLRALAQEPRSEVSAEGLGFFTKQTTGNGIKNGATDSGGLQIGYRYNFNHWLAAEADYAYSRNTQTYSGSESARVQSDVHAITGVGVVKLPHYRHFEPFALAGGGALIFDPTNNTNGSYAGASRQTKGTFVYGAGVDYPLTAHWAVRAEYRGYVYKTPDFNTVNLKTDTWTHAAQPSAGVVFRF